MQPTVNLQPRGWLAHGIPERATCHLQHPLTRTGHTEPESRPVTRVRQARPAQLTRHSLRGPLACLIQTKPSPQTIPSWVARLVGSGGVPKVSPVLPNIHPPYISLLQIEEGLQLLLRETETQRDRDGEETRLGQMPLPRSCSLTLSPDVFFFFQPDRSTSFQLCQWDELRDTCGHPRGDTFDLPGSC